jgi:hypothetical protein
MGFVEARALVATARLVLSTAPLRRMVRLLQRARLRVRLLGIAVDVAVITTDAEARALAFEVRRLVMAAVAGVEAHLRSLSG